MKVVIAIDSFKGSLSSVEAAEAIRDGILDVNPDCDIKICPIADGGEGTSAVLIEAMQGEYVTVLVSDPLGRRIEAKYGICQKNNKRTAVIEIASAAGITLINESEKNPLYTTTFGVGEMILDALNRGILDFVIGLGGSCTNDGGIGMLRALGVEFLDELGQEVSPCASGLKDIRKIDASKLDGRLKNASFTVACDVTNPLCGENGCSLIFSPQKGADIKIARKMDEWLFNFAELTEKVLAKESRDVPGVGAAGGLGYAFLTYLDGRLAKGIDTIIEKTSLKDYIKDSDIVITGEGCIDGQTVMGKAPCGIAAYAKKYGKPVIAFAGCIGQDGDLVNDYGIDACFSILRKVCSIEEALDKDNSRKGLRATVKQVFALLNLDLIK